MKVGTAMNRRAAIVLSVALLSFVSAGCGLFSSDPTVTLVMPAKAAVGSKVEAQGIYSKEAAGLEVTLTVKGDSNTLATTTTSRDGQYSFTFIAKTAGPQKLQTTVTDGQTKTTSRARALTVLDKTGVVATLSGEEETSVGQKRLLVGKVEPADDVRAVVLESSPDSKAWSATQVTAKTNTNGVFKLRIDTSKVGERHYRATVAESKSRDEASTDAVILGVYDYKASGKRYLSCVKLLNQKIDEYNQLEGFDVLKGSAARMSERSTDEAKCLRSHDWPPSVSHDIEQMAQNRDLEADVWNQMSKASTYDAFRELEWEFPDDPAAPTRVRARLGLPKRGS